ncbi:MAG: sel1 repeat family protein [Alphaproteobacteria bacterium]|nr:sel1 repeat family protein [Alphaproteobacteria bacterium]
MNPAATKSSCLTHLEAAAFAVVIMAAAIALPIGELRASETLDLMLANSEERAAGTAEGNRDAQALLGLKYVYGDAGDGGPESAAAGLRMIEEALAKGSLRAKAFYGHLMLHGVPPVSQDVDKGIQELAAAADAGLAPAARELSELFADGVLLQKDGSEARRWLERAAELGSAAAQNNLGWALLVGKDGFPPNLERSLFWIRRAAEQGQPNAQTTLAYSYQLGRGVPRDFAHARFWYEEAAAQNFGIAVLSIGIMAERGLGQPVDLEQAKAYYRQAEALGEDGGRIRLAALSGALWAEERLCRDLTPGSEANKLGTDLAEGRYWCERAAQHGDGAGRQPDPRMRTR